MKNGNEVLVERGLRGKEIFGEKNGGGGGFFVVCKECSAFRECVKREMVIGR